MSITPVFLLQITEANHDEGEFFVLGGAGFESEAARAANLATIPELKHDCQDPSISRCYTVDILDPADGWSIVDNVEVSEATAHALLGVADFEPLRQSERTMLAAVAQGWG